MTTDNKTSIPTIPAKVADQLVEYDDRFGWMLKPETVESGAVTLSKPVLERLGGIANTSKLTASEAALLMFCDSRSSIARAILAKHKPKVSVSGPEPETKTEPEPKPRKPRKPKTVGAKKLLRNK